MPVNPKHAEEYELPELTEGSGSQFYDAEGVERERLLGGQTDRDKLDGNLDADERLPLDEDREAEQIGKGTKVDSLIARVCREPSYS
jgi:hypothetical protein